MVGYAMRRALRAIPSKVQRRFLELLRHFGPRDNAQTAAVRAERFSAFRPTIVRCQALMPGKMIERSPLYVLDGLAENVSAIEDWCRNCILGIKGWTAVPRLAALAVFLHDRRAIGQPNAKLHAQEISLQVETIASASESSTHSGR
jgi:hypothetical protein